MLAEQITGGFLASFLGSNFILSIFLVGVIQYLWGLINTLQMITLTALFTGNMPQNCKRIMIEIMHFTNLDVIDCTDAIRAVFSFRAEPGPINQNFDQAGYESSNFILGLGLLFIILVLSSGLWLLR